MDITPYDLIKGERKRQIDKGFDAAHDDTHSKGELADAAACWVSEKNLYAGDPSLEGVDFDPLYPFDNSSNFLKSKEEMNRIQQLAAAGAMIVAEMERLMRSGIEVDIEIDMKTGEVLFTRDHIGVVELAKEINPDDAGTMECFVNDKPKTIDGEENYKSFCG